MTPETNKQIDKLNARDIMHLQWIHDRLLFVYRAEDNVDWMIRFRKIIEKLSQENFKGEMIRKEYPQSDCAENGGQIKGSTGQT